MPAIAPVLDEATDCETVNQVPAEADDSRPGCSDRPVDCLHGQARTPVFQSARFFYSL